MSEKTEPTTSEKVESIPRFKSVESVLVRHRGGQELTEAERQLLKILADTSVINAPSYMTPILTDFMRGRVEQNKAAFEEKKRQFEAMQAELGL